MNKCECPIQTVAQILGSKWVILILRDMFLGKTRFNEFLESNPKLHNKVLSSKLREMQDEGLIKRHTSKTSLEIEYKLSNLGENLRPVFLEMAQFGKQFCQKETDFMQFVAQVKEN